MKLVQKKHSIRVEKILLLALLAVCSLLLFLPTTHLQGIAPSISGKHSERLCFDCHPNPAASCKKCHVSEWNKLEEVGSKHSWMNCLTCHDPHTTKFWSYPDKQDMNTDDNATLCLQKRCHGLNFAKLTDPNRIDPHNTKPIEKLQAPAMNILFAFIFNITDLMGLTMLTIEYRREELR